MLRDADYTNWKSEIPANPAIRDEIQRLSESMIRKVTRLIGIRFFTSNSLSRMVALNLILSETTEISHTPVCHPLPILTPNYRVELSGLGMGVALFDAGG